MNNILKSNTDVPDEGSVHVGAKPTIHKNRLMTRLALAAAVLFGGASCSSNKPQSSVDSDARSRESAEALLHHVENLEKRVDALSEKFGLPPVNGYDAPWTQNQEAQSGASVQERK